MRSTSRRWGRPHLQTRISVHQESTIHQNLPEIHRIPESTRNLPYTRIYQKSTIYQNLPGIYQKSDSFYSTRRDSLIADLDALQREASPGLRAASGIVGSACPGPPGRLSARRGSLRKSVFYGVFVWARRALDGPKWRFPARAVGLRAAGAV